MKKNISILIMTGNLLCAAVVWLYAQEQIGIGWEFDQDGNLEGWTASPNLSNIEVRDSILSATVIGPFPYLASEEFNISAVDYRFLFLRMKLPGATSAKIMWNNDSGEWGFYWFSVQGDTFFHDYRLPIFLKEPWKGQITKITKLDFNPRLNSQIGIDYIRIVHIGPIPEIISFKPLRTIIKQGHIIPLTAVVKNSGDTEAEMNSVLTVPDGIDLIEGWAENNHGMLWMNDADTLQWQVKCDHSGDYELSLKLFTKSDTSEKKLTLSVVDEYWEPNEYFLSAWSPPYAWYPPPYDDSIFENYHKANFSIVLWIRPESDLVAKVEKYGMKYLLLISDLVGGDLYLRAPDKEVPPEITPAMLANLDQVVAQFKANPNCLGYFICDEPYAQAFANIGTVVNYLRDKDPTRLSFVNIWPGTGNSEYTNYIEMLLDQTKLELLSYDRYVFFNDRTEQSIFINNLSIIRESALAYDIPFCNIIQAIGTNGTSQPQLNWRVPNEAEHRWQVYASLAYGAKGIIWFHWHLDWGVTGSPQCEQIMASIQKTNAEINALGPIMIKLNTTVVYHSKNVPYGELPLPSNSLINSVSPNADLVVGFFKDDSDSDYVMLMNKNFNDSVTATITMKNMLAKLQYYDTDSACWQEINFENKADGAEFESRLVAGGGKLYRFGLTNPVDIQEGKIVPHQFRLYQNYPNPFNPTTTISYELATSQTVKLTVYDILGKKVADLVDQKQSAGVHQIRWFAGELASGIYFYRLQTGDKTITRKMILLR